MRVPNTVNKLKCKNLETIVEQMKLGINYIFFIQNRPKLCENLDPYPNAFDDVIQIFNQFRSNVIVLQELKSALSNAETDIDQLALRLKEEKEIVSLKLYNIQFRTVSRG